MISAWLSVALYGAVAAANVPLPNDFAYGMQLTVDDPAAAYAMALPIDVYRYSARRDLGDLRVFNANNAVVPYAVRNASTVTPSVTTEALPLFPVQAARGAALGSLQLRIDRRGDGVSTAIDIDTKGAANKVLAGYVLDARQMKKPLRALILHWPDATVDFSTTLRVEQSNDLADWHSVTSAAPVAHLRYGGNVLEQARIELPPNQYRFLRLTSPESEFPLRLARVDAEHADAAPPTLHWLTPSLAADANERGAFIFTVPGQVPMEKLRIELPSPNSVVNVELSSRKFNDNVWVRRTAGLVYRVAVRDRELASAPLTIVPSGDRQWRLRFLQAETLGGNAPAVTIGWTPAELVFLPQGAGPFLLAYGNADGEPGAFPLNDLLVGLRGDASFRVKTPRSEAPRVLGGDARRVVAAPREWTRVALWIAVSLGVVLLGAMAWRLYRDLQHRPRL